MRKILLYSEELVLGEAEVRLSEDKWGRTARYPLWFGSFGKAGWQIFILVMLSFASSTIIFSFRILFLHPENLVFCLRGIFVVLGLRTFRAILPRKDRLGLRSTSAVCKLTTSLTSRTGNYSEIRTLKRRTDTSLSIRIQASQCGSKDQAISVSIQAIIGESAIIYAVCEKPFPITLTEHATELLFRQPRAWASMTITCGRKMRLG
jgi:hypothetical protein